MNTYKKLNKILCLSIIFSVFLGNSYTFAIDDDKKIILDTAITADENDRDIHNYISETECKLEHNHQTEICEIGYYGTFLDWSTIPYSWEYGYDNSEACWIYGMWQNGLCYTTPENTYDTDVRNKIALYSDGEYLYVNVIQATVNGPNRINGTTLNFTVDGVKTGFQLVDSTGTTLESITSQGTYEVYLKHADGSVSGEFVEDSKAYVYVNQTTYNSEFEFKLPLTALAYQNPDIDMENINEVVFNSESLTYKGVTIVGVSTFPIIFGLLCLISVSFVAYKGLKSKKYVVGG